MASIKGLFKDTAIYGVSSIIGRFLNWCLVPLYTIVFPTEEYGIVTYIYSIVALTLIILIYGMETGFFRFANHERYDNPGEVYSTSLISLASTSTIFSILVFIFLSPISKALNCEFHSDFILLMALTTAIDAFTAIPFSWLRYKKRPIKFAVIKLINIGLNIGLNLFFILLCPWLSEVAPSTIDWFYDPTYGIGYIFLSNFISSIATLLMLLPEVTSVPFRFNPRLWREMIVYSMPLLVLGIAGIMNQTIDKIIYPMLVTDTEQAMSELGIYGANYKIGIIMVMFIQAFRFAYEPFIFSQNKEKGNDSKTAYRDAMKYFIIFALFIFLGVIFYLDIVKYFISPQYFSGLKVVPIIMLAELFFGIFFNLSIWYKITDQTIWGAWFSIIGLAITLSINILFVPTHGYMACAWAAFVCYGVMMTISYLIGRAKYPIDYNIPRIIFYVVVAAILFVLSKIIEIPCQTLNLIYRTALLGIYIVIVCKRESLRPIDIMRRRLT